MITFSQSYFLSQNLFLNLGWQWSLAPRRAQTHSDGHVGTRSTGVTDRRWNHGSICPEGAGHRGDVATARDAAQRSERRQEIPHFLPTFLRPDGPHPPRSQGLRSPGNTTYRGQVHGQASHGSKWSITSDSVQSFSEVETITIIPSLRCDCYCSVIQSCLTLCDPLDHSMPVSSVLHHLPEFAQIHVHWVGVAI